MRFAWPVEGPPVLMGILNVTPDSFSDGGRYLQLDAARQHAEALLAAGATIIDIGGESTRPGAAPVSEQQELDRVLPVIEAVCALGAVVSVDSSRAGVMRAALQVGAAILNDVRALTEQGALALAIEYDAAVCLMHMQGDPRTMQQQPHYRDVVTDVRQWLLARAAACEQAGLHRSRICLDPGFGFGKTSSHNLRLLQQLASLCAQGYPVLAGLSRKSLIGQLTGVAVDKRQLGSVVLALLAAQQGARILRVHDVAETQQALQLWQAMVQA
ncbi:dihydropteroate synthase [Permianibacter sp. IMCC34836]|uniref:dihydropteroate synthase n=1 Tax=Permianibacter fluminis TaxID=2738515 RepID=UPI001552F584|nr:dihydropteroate synthase [Permianibacter fluminis]NQD36500.1 dihydropteroate synthase [Permianibacter fluminis]